MSRVLALLDEKTLHYVQAGQENVKIKCLNPEHDDSNPSCQVHVHTGAVHCFSCGFKTNIYKHFGMQTHFADQKTYAIKKKIRNILDNKPLAIPPGSVPVREEFRGLTLQTLRDHEAFESTEYPNTVLFPIRNYSNDITHLLGRYKTDNVKPKYMVEPKGRPLGMYPLKKFEAINGWAILVEGIFDYLNLKDNNLDASLCTFGCNSITEKSHEKFLMPLLATGCTKFLFMYDADKAGREGVRLAKEIMEKYYPHVQVKSFNLGDGRDPGDLNQDEIADLKEKLLAL